MLQRTRAVNGLIRLKSYEQPAPGSEGRCLAEVRDRIAIYQSWQHQGTRTEAVGAGFGWRFSFAAAFVILIGFNLVTSSRLPSFQPLAHESRSDPRAPVAANLMAKPNPVFENLYASNRMDNFLTVSEPGGIHYQPKVSRPGPYYSQTSYQEK